MQFKRIHVYGICVMLLHWTTRCCTHLCRPDPKNKLRRPEKVDVQYVMDHVCPHLYYWGEIVRFDLLPCKRAARKYNRCCVSSAIGRLCFNPSCCSVWLVSMVAQSWWHDDKVMAGTNLFDIKYCCWRLKFFHCYALQARACGRLPANQSTDFIEGVFHVHSVQVHE